MIEELEQVIFCEEARQKYSLKMKRFHELRDEWIFYAFEAGIRQRTIADLTGLSESTVKHIIAKRKIK